MTKEMFFELFNVNENSDLVESIYSKYDDESSINWMREAKAQIATLNILAGNI